jgi:soluble lytic murein transglycosylase
VVTVVVAVEVAQPPASARAPHPAADPHQLALPTGPEMPAFGLSADARAISAHGHQLTRRGEYGAAARHYATMADQLGPDTAPRALLLQAHAAFADRDTATAAAALERLLTNHAGSGQVPDALFLLGVVRRAAGDCPGALAALLEYEAHVGPAALGPYLALQRAACYTELDDPENTLAAANAALAADAGAPRLARVHALESAAVALLKLGRRREALDIYNQLLDLATTRNYRAEMLFNTATLARALGDHELAAERFRAVVVDYPDQPRAPGALEALDEMGRVGTISPYQAGLVRLNAREYGAALTLFEQTDAAHPDAGASRFNHAVALGRLREDEQAVQELQHLAETNRAWAGSALLRAGRALESSGKLAEADAAYTRLGHLDPTSDRLAEAHLRAGLTRYFRDDVSGAIAAWQAALDPGHKTTPGLKAQTLFWLGKALAKQHGSSSAEARDAWTRAVAAAPETYYGLRAQDLLAGQFVPTNPVVARDVATLQVSPAEAKEWTEWLARTQVRPEDLAAALAGEPGLARADVLLGFGLREEAGWEIEALTERYAAAKDVARLSALAEWLAARDLPNLTLQLGRRERDLLQTTLFGMPRVLQKHDYPAGWGDIAFEQAAMQGFDPLLLLGLVRQESTFNARAQSSARAMGLTQVIPSTANEIARHLGRSHDFQVRDLLRPGISLEFGAWYLARQLERYGGQIFPALAAYNAGGGNADTWLREFGDDPDVFAERIPFAETHTYVKHVYENYRIYRQLYQ